MSKENVALIKGVYDAFSKGDVPAVLGATSPNIVWNEAENFPYADKNPYVGPDAIVQGVFMRLATEWDGFTVLPADGPRLAHQGRQGRAVPAICRHAAGRASSRQGISRRLRPPLNLASLPDESRPRCPAVLPQPSGSRPRLRAS